MRPACLIASLMFLLLLSPVSGQEPTWRQRKLADWKKQLQDPNPELRIAAALEFRFMELALLKASTEELTKAFKDVDYRVQTPAYWAMERLRENAAGSVPELVTMLERKGEDAEDYRARDKAVETLANIGGKEVVAILASHLGNHRHLDEDIALALCRQGAAAEPALPALKKLIRADAEPLVLIYACMAIAALEPDAPEVQQAIALITPMERLVKGGNYPPYLIQEFLIRFPELTIQHVVPLLEDKDKQVRRSAARILVAAGPRAKEKVTTPLKKILQDPEPSVRIEAVHALYVLAPAEFGEAIPVLVGLLGTGTIDGHQAALMLRPRPEDSFSLLLAALDKKDPGDQHSIVEALYGLRYSDPASKAPLDPKTIQERDAMLIAALADPSLRIRRGTAATARMLGPQVSALIPALLELTKDADAEARLDAISALVSVDPGHHSWLSWLPSLEVVVRDGGQYARQRALWEIRRLGPAAKSAAPTLLLAAADKDEYIRTLAAINLVFADPAQKTKVLPVLLEVAKRVENANLTDVAEALAEFGPAAKDGIPALQAALIAKRKFPNQMVKIVKALCRIDRGQIAACRPDFETLFKTPGGNWRPKAEALNLLPEWGAEAKPLLPVVRELLKKDRVQEQVQIAAAISLVILGDGEDSKAGVESLRKAIADQDGGRKGKYLLQMAEQLGPLARPLVPELRPLAGDARLAEDAKRVLAKIDPKMD